jgi:Nucleotide modification associated domain 1
MNTTETEYLDIISSCFEIFSKKNTDYGTSWKILRLPSITDQIFIKAQRIRTIQENGFSKVDEGEVPEFIGIINYCIMAIMMIDNKNLSETLAELQNNYKAVSNEIKDLLFAKNHDYNEAWRSMRVSSMTDIILMKLLRIKQIEDNQGKTLISEGIKSGYQDIVNYSVFCLIKLKQVQQMQVQQQ